MGFVYIVLWILKGMWIVLSENFNSLRNLQKLIFFFFFGGGRKFYQRLMYFRDHSLRTLNLPFKVILRRFLGCCLMSVVRMLHFSIDWWKFIQNHQYYIMAFREEFWLGTTAKPLVAPVPSQVTAQTWHIDIQTLHQNCSLSVCATNHSN